MAKSDKESSDSQKKAEKAFKERQKSIKDYRDKVESRGGIVTILHDIEEKLSKITK